MSRRQRSGMIRRCRSDMRRMRRCRTGMSIRSRSGMRRCRSCMSIRSRSGHV